MGPSAIESVRRVGRAGMIVGAKRKSRLDQIDGGDDVDGYFQWQLSGIRV